MPRDRDSYTRALRDRLESLRSRRVRTHPDKSMRASFQEARQLDVLSQRQLGRLGEAWEELCPDAVLERTTLLRYQRAVLTVGVDSSATLYTLKRALRQPLIDELARRGGVALQRVELRLSEGASA